MTAAADCPPPVGAATDLGALETALEAATPGPWVQHPADPSYVLGDMSADGEDYLDVADTGASRTQTEAEADAALIVALHTAAPALIARVRAADAMEAQLRGLAEELEEDAQRHDDAEPIDGRGLHAAIAASRVSRHAAARLLAVLDAGAGS